MAQVWHNLRPMADTDRVSFRLAVDGDVEGAKSFTLQRGDLEIIRVGRGAKNDLVLGLPSISWTHLELKLVPRGGETDALGGGVQLAVCDTSNNGTGLQVSGGSMKRVGKGVDVPISDRSVIQLPMRARTGEPRKTLVVILVAARAQPSPVSEPSPPMPVPSQTCQAPKDAIEASLSSPLASHVPSLSAEIPAPMEVKPMPSPLSDPSAVPQAPPQESSQIRAAARVAEEELDDQPQVENSADEQDQVELDAASPTSPPSAEGAKPRSPAAPSSPYQPFAGSPVRELPADLSPADRRDDEVAAPVSVTELEEERAFPQFRQEEHHATNRPKDDRATPASPQEDTPVEPDLKRTRRQLPRPVPAVRNVKRKLKTRQVDEGGVPPHLRRRVQRGQVLVDEAVDLDSNDLFEEACESYRQGLRYILEVLPYIGDNDPFGDHLRERVSTWLEKAERVKIHCDSRRTTWHARHK
uniref:FHA domain-containing protein n=1 Tax=Noctiluca scintillans TaxID=2966 RepID=A0A7S1F2L0_NOCSC